MGCSFCVEKGYVRKLDMIMSMPLGKRVLITIGVMWMMSGESRVSQCDVDVRGS